MNQIIQSRRASCRSRRIQSQQANQLNRILDINQIQEQISLKQCIIYPIDTILKRNSIVCPKCQITLCYFCATESCHSSHMNGKVKQQKYGVCQCNDSTHHQINHFKLFLLKCYKVYLVQDEMVESSSTFEIHKSILEKMDKIKKHQILVDLFNFIFEKDIIYESLFKQFKIHIKQLKEILEGGDPDAEFYQLMYNFDFNRSIDMPTKSFNENLQECFSPSMFQYSFVLSNLRILKILSSNLKIQKRFLVLSQNFKNTYNFEFFALLIRHYVQIFQTLDDQSRSKLQQIFKFVLDSQELQLKEEFHHYRKIETKSIENSNLISRLSIQDFNIYQRITRKLRAPIQIYKLIKEYLIILLELEADDFQKDILLHFLKIIKLVLKCRLILKLKSVSKILQKIIIIFKNISSYRHQQANNSKLPQIEDTMFDQKIYTLLSDILVQSFYFFKDDQFQQIIQQDYQLLSRLSTLHNQSDKASISTQLFDSKNDEFQTIFNILISILVNKVLKTKIMSNTASQKKALSMNMLNLISEQLFSRSFYIKQIYYLSENIISSFQLQKSILKEYLKDEYRQTFEDYDKLDEQYLKEFQSFLNEKCQKIQTIIEDTLFKCHQQSDIQQLAEIIDALLQHPFTQAVAQFVLQTDKSLISQASNYVPQGNLNTSDRNNYPKINELKDVNQFQLILYLAGIDQILLRILSIRDSMFEQIQQYNTSPLYHVINSRIYQIFLLYTYQNKTNFCQVMQKNNLKIFQSTICRLGIQRNIFLNDQTTNLMISFYHKMVLRQYQDMNLLEQSSILFSNKIFIEHILGIFRIIHMQYTDVSELTIPLAFDINLNQTKLVEILNITIEHINLEGEEQTESYLEYLFINSLPDIIDHLKEICSDNQDQDFSDASAMEILIHEKQNINRFAKVNLFQSLEELKTIKQQISSNSKTYEKIISSFSESEIQGSNMSKSTPLINVSVDDDQYSTIFWFKQNFLYNQNEDKSLSYSTKLHISLFLITFEFFRLLNVILELQTKRQLIDLNNKNIKIQRVEQKLIDLVGIILENQTDLFTQLLEIIDLRMEINKFLVLMFERQQKYSLFQSQNQQKEKEKDPLFYQEEDYKKDKLIILFRQIVEAQNQNFDNYSSFPLSDRQKEVNDIQLEHNTFYQKQSAKSQQLLLFNLEQFQNITNIIYNIQNLPQEIRDHFIQNFITQSIIYPFECLVNLYKIMALYQVKNSTKLDLLQMFEIMETIQTLKKIMIDILTKKNYILVNRKTSGDIKNDIIIQNLKKTSLKMGKSSKSFSLTIEDIILKYDFDFSKDQIYQNLTKIQKSTNVQGDQSLRSFIDQYDSLNLVNLDRQGLLILLVRDHRSKNTDHIGNILVNYFVHILQPHYHESSHDPHSLEQYSYKKFLQQTKIVKLILKYNLSISNRMMIIETKLFQLLFQKNIENHEDQFGDKFTKSLIFQSTNILPQLCSNVIHFEVIEHPSIIQSRQQFVIQKVIHKLVSTYNSFGIWQRDKINTCKLIWEKYYKNVIILKIGVLENLMQLFVDIIKSRHITDIFSKNFEAGNHTPQIRKVSNTLQIKQKAKTQSNLVKLSKIFIINKAIKHFQYTRSQSIKSGYQILNEENLYSKHQNNNDIKILLKLFAHIVTAIAEMNQGQLYYIQLGECRLNQRLTFDFISKNRVWPIIIKILSIKAPNNSLNSIYTLRTYIFQMILPLLEDTDKISENFLFIMKTINFKVLEETLNQTFKRLININGLGDENSDQFQNIQKISLNLTKLYKMYLGDDINESLVFDKKILIKILYQIYKILNLYATVNQEVLEYLEYFKLQCSNVERNGEDAVNIAAFRFIFSIVGRIEYVNHNNQLEVFHFFLPPMSYFLSSETKLQFLSQNVDRTNPSSKLFSIIDVVPEFMIEMAENMNKYRKSKFYSQILNIVVSRNFHHKQFSIILVMLNFITLILISNNHYVELTPKSDQHIRQLTFKISHPLLLFVSEFFLTFCSFTALLCQLFLRMSIYYKLIKSKKITKKTNYYTDKLLNILKVFSKRDIFQFTLHFILSLLGLIVDPLFFYIQSFLFIYISKTMYSVLEALKLRWVQFIGIFTFIMIILNLYSYIGYRSFTTSFQLDVMIQIEDDFTEEEILCDSPIHCFLSLVYLGLRDGAGLGAYGDNESYYKSSDYYPRLMFDFSFFLIVTLIMLNIVYGIIIDTFADLRDQESSIEHDMKNVCLICSVQRWQFDKKGLNFAMHINETHKVWFYTSFLVHLNLIGKENMNGIETYIFKKVKDKDLSWIPQERTKMLEI